LKDCREKPARCSLYSSLYHGARCRSANGRDCDRLTHVRYQLTPIPSPFPRASCGIEHVDAPSRHEVSEIPNHSLTNLLRNYSAEVTSEDKKSIEAATEMEPGSEVFIASLPSDSIDRQVQTAARLRRAGLTPVPHVVARKIKNAEELDVILKRLVADAGIDRVLLIAGDRDQPVGEFDSSLQLLETGLLSQYGIRKVALSWYPEGHPRIQPADLVVARAAKLAAARKANLDVTLVSQFCFESAPILATVRQMRSEGVTVPLRLGVAGPASRASLLKYAMICGVGASIRALKERPSARNILAGDGPGDVLSDVALAQAEDPTLGIQASTFSHSPLFIRPSNLSRSVMDWRRVSIEFAVVRRSTTESGYQHSRALHRHMRSNDSFVQSGIANGNCQ
jgi:methylenetetrahydrofolate reductase (NADPH)